MKTMSLVILFFLSIIFVGSLFLILPGSMLPGYTLSYIDALFLSVSSISVTGLAPVSLVQFSLFGKWVLLLLIQIGGLGFISIATFFLLSERGRQSSEQNKLMQVYSLKNENKLRNVVGRVILYTLLIEAFFVIILWVIFFVRAENKSLFYILFHVVSAFSNAGFTLEHDSLFSWQKNYAALGVIAILIVLGGLGFIVIQDMWEVFRKRKSRLSFHSVFILILSLFFIFGGFFSFVVFEIFERKSLNFDRLFNLFFYNISTRTAGFHYIPVENLGFLSKFLSLLMMFIGAAPGSTAGGIKMNAFAIVLLSLFRPFDSQGLRLRNSRIDVDSVYLALNVFIRAVVLLVVAFLLLYLFEKEASFSLFALLFEAFSALGTVGLSLGVTPGLSIGSKIVLMFLMFIGKIGLLIFTFPRMKNSRYTFAAKKVLY